MATGNKRFSPVTLELLTSFVMPDGIPAMGIAPVSEHTAWMMVSNLPMVILIDTTGHVYQRVYTDGELRRDREKTTINNMSEIVRVKGLAIQRIVPGGSDDCFVLSSKESVNSVQHINKSGAVSKVISGLNGLGAYSTFGLAYLPESSEKGKVLYGYLMKGICSIRWPMNRLLTLFSPPQTFYPENFHDGYLSIAVDKKSDLVAALTTRNKIVCLNRKGQKVSEYTSEDIKTELDMSLAFDHTGCIIVYNPINNTVFRFSPDGDKIQTVFPESENASVCNDCKKLGTAPKCRDCKYKIILAVGLYNDFLWVSRFTGDLEIYRLK